MKKNGKHLIQLSIARLARRRTLPYLAGAAMWLAAGPAVHGAVDSLQGYTGSLNGSGQGTASDGISWTSTWSGSTGITGSTAGAVSPGGGDRSVVRSFTARSSGHLWIRFTTRSTDSSANGYYGIKFLSLDSSGRTFYLGKWYNQDRLILEYPSQSNYAASNPPVSAYSGQTNAFWAHVDFTQGAYGTWQAWIGDPATFQRASPTVSGNLLGASTFSQAQLEGNVAATFWGFSVETNEPLFAAFVETPGISPNGGTHTNSVTVTLSTGTAKADLRYTLNGSDPTEASFLYESPFALMSNATVKARGYKTGLNASQIASASFTLVSTNPVATPAISPAGGTFIGEVQVSISCATAGAAIHYTTNGLPPGTNSPVYGGPFTVRRGLAVRARAFKTGSNPSAAAKASFTLVNSRGYQSLSAADYYDAIKGCWIGQLSANFTGLGVGGLGKYFEGTYTTLRDGGPDTDFPKNRPDLHAYHGNAVNSLNQKVWRTDDDSDIEWTGLHMMIKHGLDTITYAQIRDEWIAHINNSIWVANATARQLMGTGTLPPHTGKQGINGYYDSIDAQIEIEVFGQIAPGMLQNALDRADFWARVTNDKDAVDAAKFYAHLAADAFVSGDLVAMIERARSKFPSTSRTYLLAGNILSWYAAYPNDWRECRRRIYDNYHEGFYMSKVNLACTLMALLYGEGDFTETVRVACLAGYDADCNAATSASIVGTINGFSGLPVELTSRIPSPTDKRDYSNSTRDLDPTENTNDLSGATLLRWDRVAHAPGDAPPYNDICARIQGLAEQNVTARGGSVVDGEYAILGTVATNGIPEAYFHAYGWTNNYAAWAEADPDQDGVKTSDEWKANTDPTAVGSVLQMTSDNSGQASGPVVRWQSAPGVVYRLLRRSDLADPSDPVVTVRSGIAATPPENSEPDPTATGSGPYFYWVEVE